MYNIKHCNKLNTKKTFNGKILFNICASSKQARRPKNHQQIRILGQYNKNILLNVIFTKQYL